jgi:hypothetical protein
VFAAVLATVWRSTSVRDDRDREKKRIVVVVCCEMVTLSENANLKEGGNWMTWQVVLVLW